MRLMIVPTLLLLMLMLMLMLVLLLMLMLMLLMPLLLLLLLLLMIMMVDRGDAHGWHRQTGGKRVAIILHFLLFPSHCSDIR